MADLEHIESDVEEVHVKRSRQRSEIEFPYSDIGQAEDLVRKLNDRGGGKADPEQLAAWMNQSSRGGSFRSRLSAARKFGFVETKTGSIEITDNGRRALDPARADHARAEAFLRVPLFERMFRKNVGHVLPPSAAIERQMVDLGVPERQKGRARQVFVKSAKLAQYIEESSGRFVKPAVKTPSNQSEEDQVPQEEEDSRTRSSKIGDVQYHPFVIGLLNELPETDRFAEWTIDEQAEWLRASASIFKLLSKTEGRIEIAVVAKEGAPTEQGRSGHVE